MGTVVHIGNRSRREICELKWEIFFFILRLRNKQNDSIGNNEPKAEFTPLTSCSSLFHYLEGQLLLLLFDH